MIDAQTADYYGLSEKGKYLYFGENAQKVVEGAVSVAEYHHGTLKLNGKYVIGDSMTHDGLTQFVFKPIVAPEPITYEPIGACPTGTCSPEAFKGYGKKKGKKK